MSLLSAIREGAVARDRAIPEVAIDWAALLAKQLLHLPNADNSNLQSVESMQMGNIPWTFVPDKLADDNPWSTTTKRSSTDHPTIRLYSSFPLGERQTGTLRSEAFPLPDYFQFYLAGHDGAPNLSPQGKNWVRLRDASSNQVLFECNPPGQDVAQRVRWEPESESGKPVYVELVDGDDGPAYAWLAAGQFSVAGLNPTAVDEEREMAADLIAEFQLNSLIPAVKVVLKGHSVHRRTMRSLFRCLVTLNHDDESSRAKADQGSRALATALSATPTVVGARDELLDRVSDQFLKGKDAAERDAEKLLGEAMRVATAEEQVRLVEPLVSPAGAKYLFAILEAGYASARVLQAAEIRPKLPLLSRSHRERAAKIANRFPSEDDSVAEKILEVRHAYTRDGGDDVAGRKLFLKHCQACHRMGSDGQQVGPNLDGIGNRGLNRLTEDIFAPSRNVDAGFVASLIATSDGQTHLGLVKDKNAAVLVLVNLQGKEVRIASSSVEEWTPSNVSPMPANFSQVLTTMEARNLLAYLLGRPAK